MKGPKDIKIFRWNEEEKALYILDQRKVPEKFKEIKCKTHEEVAQAIENIIVRGASAIAICAAYGVVLGALESKDLDLMSFKQKMEFVILRLAATRPTAVNLFWALNRMKKILQMGMNVKAICEALEAEVKAMELEDIQKNRAMSKFGAELLSNNEHVLTYCNTGDFATAGYGTALGVIRTAVETGKNIFVYVSETRPYHTGSRLTGYELENLKIPYEIITEGMVGYLMHKGDISCVLVGADRIAANGDIAGKIGTYALSVLAKEHNIPFYVVAPTCSFDLSCSTGDKIPLEERKKEDIIKCPCSNLFGERSKYLAPKGAKVKTYYFDITPAENITAIITEKGVIGSPNEERIREFFENLIK